VVCVVRVPSSKIGLRRSSRKTERDADYSDPRRQTRLKKGLNYLELQLAIGAIFGETEEIWFVAQKLFSVTENIESALEKILSALQIMLSMTEIKL
jgi:hypothetical protein